MINNKEKKVRVKLLGEWKEYPLGTSYFELAMEYQSEFENDIVLLQVDNRLQEMHKTLEEECEIQFLTTQDTFGFEAYRRSVTHMFIKAVHDVLEPQKREEVKVHYSVGAGFYCTTQSEEELNQSLLNKIRERMHELRDAKLPIVKTNINTEAAIKLFNKHGMYDKELLFHYRRVSRVNLYSINQFEDYYYGPMVCNTEYLKYFELYLYDEGLVLQLPTKKDPKMVPPLELSHKIFQILKESTEWGNMLEVPSVGALNQKITKGSIKELILIQEALQEKKIADIAEKIVKEPSKQIVMIAGPSSSGKTTFSHRLSIQLEANGKRPHPIAVDNYFINRDSTPIDEFGKPDFECLEAIDVEKFNEDMKRLLAGETVELPVYNFATGMREYKGDYKKLEKNDVLVIEGIHCLNDALSYSLPHENKFKIYISALTQLNIDGHNRIPTRDGRLIRRMVRDARTRGTDAKKTLNMWASVRRGEDKNIFPYQDEADVMFNTALIYELSVLKMYAEPILFGIDKDEPEYLEAKRLLKFLDYFIGVPSEDVPYNSILREFVGGGSLHA